MPRQPTLLLVLCVLLSACQSLSEKHQSSLLLDTLNRYEATVRWGDLEQAQGFAQDGIRPAGEQAADDLRVTRYEVVQGPSAMERNRAVQVVMIEYVFQSTQQVRQVLDQQVWLYDEDSASWSRLSPIPDFR